MLNLKQTHFNEPLIHNKSITEYSKQKAYLWWLHDGEIWRAFEAFRMEKLRVPLMVLQWRR